MGLLREKWLSQGDFVRTNSAFKMENAIEGSHDAGSISLAINGLPLDTTCNTQGPTDNQNILYIAVEYVKDEFKLDSRSNLSFQQNYNELEQHVSSLDPNMSSVARYSPVYTSDSSVSYNSPIIVTHVVTNEGSDDLSNVNSSELRQVPTRFLQMVDNQTAHESTANIPLQHIPNTAEEVELLITDQNTGISYSVSTQEYLVERCLADEQHLLENLSPESLLDSDLLALDESTLKSQLSEVVIDPTDQNRQIDVGDNLHCENVKIENIIFSKSTTTGDVRRSLRQTEANNQESEEHILSCVHSISDKPVPTRAWATLPESYLAINKLNDEFGVFARKMIPQCTQFGPLEGNFLNIDNVKVEDEKLDFLIENADGQIMRLDITDENSSNWMCFVRRATNYTEQNLVLIHQMSSLYYVTVRNILPKQELKVGYSKLYAQKFNLQILMPVQDEENMWHCYECSEKFTSSEDFQKHLDVHDESNASSCKLKKKKRKNSSSKLTKTEAIECNVCGEIFVQAKTNILRKHLLQHGLDLDTIENKFSSVAWHCKHCNQAFQNQEDLDNHCVQHDAKNKIAQNSTDDVTSKQEHVTPNKPQDRSYKCPICYKVFASIERIQRHMLVHGSEDSKPLKCDKCNKRFLNNSALTCHLKTHSTGRKQFECPICRQTFHYILQLKLHVPQHCVNGQYMCPHCSKLFSKYSIIRKHIRSFHCERKHPCPDCPKHFPTLDKLRMHLLKHSDHREFLCADCGKQFKRKDKLKEHCKRMHSEERENAVPRTSKSINGLHSPKKFTPKVQPTDYHRFIYKCHTCLVGFKRRGMLVNHLAKRHPDISPSSVPELNLPILRTTRDYYCQYCEKVYKSSSKRKAHILKNHPGAALPLSNRRHASASELPNPTYSQTVGSVTTHPQACQWCHKQYASKAKLLQHQRKKHLELLNGQPNEKLEQAEKHHTLEMKVTDEEIFAHLEQDYQLVTMDAFAQPADTDSRLYRLLTTTNNLVPPR